MYDQQFKPLIDPLKEIKLSLNGAYKRKRTDDDDDLDESTSSPISPKTPR